MSAMERSASEIIKALGGTTAAATLVGAPVTTVHAWKVKGSIPKWRMPAVEKALASIQSEQAA